MLSTRASVNDLSIDPIVIGNDDSNASTPANGHRCTHCDLPVPQGLVEPDSVEQFCCGGCRVAYRLIRGCGLDAYYSLAEPLHADQSLRNRKQNESGFLEFDQPAFLEKFARKIDENRRQTTLCLDGIHCAACIWLIEKLPQIVPGVTEVHVNWARQTVLIRWNSNQVPLSEIAGKLDQLGYTPYPVRESENDNRRRLENRKHLVRIGIAAAAAGNNMLIAAALYLGMFSYMSMGMNQMLRIASCIVGLGSLFGPGRIFLRGAVSAIRTHTPHMDLPIALGLTVGTVAGVVNTVRGTGEIWFDSLSVLILLLLVGRWIQFRQQTRAADSVEMLHRLTPQRARKLVDGTIVETFADSLEVHDQLEIRAGDLLPVDGIITTGTTSVDESILTGESRPVQKNCGDLVLAGCQNKRSRIVVRTTATGNDTRLSKIVGLVEQSASKKPEVVQWANRIGGHFVIVIMTLALITLVTWLWLDPAVAVDRTVALLIVACPCALAIATPLAIAVALGRAAKQKIMVKGGDVLQSINQPGIIWLDKTGTLTSGKLKVERWYGDTRWQVAIARIESTSTHPIARAIVDYIDADGSFSNTLKDIAIVEREGQGIRANWFGDQILIGNAQLLADNAISISRRQQRIVDRILGANLSPCFISVNGTLSAILAIGDRLRADTKVAVDQLKTEGWKVGILSGDHPNIVQRVAAQLGIEPGLALGGVEPEGKVKVVQESQHQTVVMVGDGVNDSAALAAATVGIAVHGGAEASLTAAPVFLARPGLSSIVRLIAISRSTARTMRISFCFSLTYNTIGAALAFLGYINPLVAAILMPISSLTVVAISLTAGKSKP